MNCKKCGFELDDKDTFCPKCGEKVIKDKKPFLIYIVVGVSIIVLISISIILIRMLGKSNDETVGKTKSDDVQVIGFEASSEEDDPVQSESIVSDEKEDELINEIEDKGTYYDCKGAFGSEFDDSVIGMNFNDFCNYANVSESTFSDKSKLDDEGAVYVISRNYDTIELAGIDIKECNDIYVKDDTIITFGINISFENSSSDKETVNKVFESFINDIVKRPGEGDYYSCNLERISSEEDFYGELCWKNDIVTVLLSAGEEHIDIKYGSSDFLSKPDDDAFAKFFVTEYDEHEKCIKWVNEDGYKAEYENKSLNDYQPGFIIEADGYVVTVSKSMLSDSSVEGRRIDFYYYDAEGKIIREIAYDKIQNKDACKEICHNLRLDSVNGCNALNLEHWEADYYYTDNYVVTEYSKEYLDSNHRNMKGAIAVVINEWLAKNYVEYKL